MDEDQDNSQRPMGTKKLVGYYRSPKEAERDHPNIDRNVLMLRSEFEDILGQNEFEEAEWVTCQLEKLKHPGSMCMKLHGNGWIMLNKSGAAGYIGGDCANEYFEAHEAFAGATSRARREVSLQRMVARLRALLEEANSHRSRALQNLERLRRLSRKVRAWREDLPYDAKERLYDAAKTGNSSVRVEFQTPTKVEDDKRQVKVVTKWLLEPIATFIAPRALDISRLDPIDRGVRGALDALDRAAASLERKTSEMREWAEAIEAIDSLERQLNDCEAELSSFEQPGNLQLLCWLCRDNADQITCARLALQPFSRKTVSNSDAKRALYQWYGAIVAAHGDRQFRVP